MENINKFCKDNGFKYQVGEVGFMRPCVGIIDPKSDAYIDYQVWDNNELFHSAEKAENAYHKHPCLAVLMDETTPENITKATDELENWVGRIIEMGYEIKTHIETNSIGALINGTGRQELKCIVDKKTVHTPSR